MSTQNTEVWGGLYGNYKVKYESDDKEAAMSF
jgi:hypothetical protein